MMDIDDSEPVPLWKEILYWIKRFYRAFIKGDQETYLMTIE